ncbi:unnamed protein product, partial [Adineta steineri]
DRITPATTNSNGVYVRSHCSIADGWSVISKLYVPWITKDSFCNGRPPPELLSVPPYNIFLTEYVEAYKCMKMHHIQKCVIVIFMNNEVKPTLHLTSEQHKRENDPHYCALAVSA